jgi:hypothetical protein
MYDKEGDMSGGIILILIAIVVAVGIFIYFWVFTSEDKTLVITAQEAFYQVPVEDYQPRQKGGWDETVPADAYNQNAYSKQRGSHQVYTGQTCTGSGKDETCHSNYISVPDYDTWVNYTVNRWEVKRIATAAYHSSKENLLCPDPDVYEDSPENIHFGSQRATLCLKAYSVTMELEGEKWSCPVKSDDWFTMPIEKVVTMKVGTYTRAPWCDTLKVQ